MASIQKRVRDGVTRYYVRWREPGPEGRVVERTKSHERKKDADQHFDEVQADESLGRPWAPRVVRADADLEAGMRAWLSDLARNQKPASVRSASEDLAVFVRFLEGTRRPVAWTSLNQQMLADFYDWCGLKENSLHGTQARAKVTVIRLVKSIQRFWKFCSNSDVFGVHAGIPKELAMKGSPRKRTVAPTFAEAARCVLACRRWHRSLSTVLYGTGLRANQAMRLLWSDVDMERGLLTIRPELGKTEAEASGRIVPIAPWLVQELAGWGTREGYLIKTGRSGQRERQARDRPMANAWKRTGVREEAWTGRPHHAFRKAFASGLKALGADDEAVEYLCGRTLPGERGTYVDGTTLPLAATVALIPAPLSFAAEPAADPGIGGLRLARAT